MCPPRSPRTAAGRRWACWTASAAAGRPIRRWRRGAPESASASPSRAGRSGRRRGDVRGGATATAAHTPRERATPLASRRAALHHGRGMRSIPRVLIAIGAGLALADASVVTLALPPMLVDLGTTVEGVAAVIGVYTLVLAVALPLAARLRSRMSDPALGAAGFGVFALAGALSALPQGIEAMLAFRAL